MVDELSKYEWSPVEKRCKYCGVTMDTFLRLQSFVHRLSEDIQAWQAAGKFNASEKLQNMPQKYLETVLSCSKLLSTKKNWKIYATSLKENVQPDYFNGAHAACCDWCAKMKRDYFANEEFGEFVRDKLARLLEVYDYFHKDDTPLNEYPIFFTDVAQLLTWDLLEMTLDEVCRIVKIGNSMFFELEDGFRVEAGSAATYDALVNYGFYNEKTGKVNFDIKDRFYILQDKLFKYHELGKILDKIEDHIYGEPESIFKLGVNDKCDITNHGMFKKELEAYKSLKRPLTIQEKINFYSVCAEYLKFSECLIVHGSKKTINIPCKIMLNTVLTKTINQNNYINIITFIQKEIETLSARC